MTSGRREPSTRWAGQVKAQLDTYYGKLEVVEGVNEKTALAHALQKDGIQNCMDAEDTESEDEWECEIGISSLSKSPEYLYIRDFGTTGLTGRDFVEKDELEKLEKNDEKKFEEERWARFEGAFYGHTEAKKGGARGMGKFIFVGCSDDSKIIYDTLLKNGTYRLGEWDITKTKPLLENPLHGNDAKQYLKENVPALKSLDRVGTRIIILRPKSEVVNAFIPFEKSDIEAYISSTWWELLAEGYKIKLRVDEDSIEREVKTPKIYQDLYDNPNKFPKKRELTNISIDAVAFKGCKVKEFKIAYSDEKLPPLLQGVSVQRGRMKIESFDVRKGNEFIPNEYKDHIFGWITFNDDAEELLRKNEDPTHYGFTALRGSLAREIVGREGFLEKQIRIFAEKQLGLSPFGKVTAERDVENINVTSRLNYIAKNWFGWGSEGPGKKKRKEKEEKKNPTGIRVIFEEPVFPREIKRVEFGEKVSGIECKVKNYEQNPAKVQLTLSLEKKDTVAGGYIEIKQLEKQDINLGERGESELFGPHEIIFKRDDYNEGIYAITATVKALEELKELGKGKGDEIHSIRHLIYLGRNPPAGGLFKDVNYTDEIGKKRYRLIGDEESGYVLQISIRHPLYKRADKMQTIVEEKKIEKIPNVREQYEVETGVIAMIVQDLRTEGKLLEEGKYKGMYPKLKNEIYKENKGLDAIITDTDAIEQELLFEALE